jgi:hypothetical protein
VLTVLLGFLGSGSRFKFLMVLRVHFFCTTRCDGFVVDRALCNMKMGEIDRRAARRTKYVTVLESLSCTTYHSFMSPLLYHIVQLTPLVYTTPLFCYIYYNRTSVQSFNPSYICAVSIPQQNSIERFVVRTRNLTGLLPLTFEVSRDVHNPIRRIK